MPRERLCCPSNTFNGCGEKLELHSCFFRNSQLGGAHKLLTSGESKMKRVVLGLLLASIAGAAGAADMSAPRAAYTKAPMMSPAINWTGFYIGAMGGYASEATSDSLRIKGGFAGGTLGYNWQSGMMVLGLEWMFTRAWSLKTEYLYRRFDSQTYFTTQLPPGIASGTLAMNSLQVGINYHF